MKKGPPTHKLVVYLLGRKHSSLTAAEAEAGNNPNSCQKSVSGTGKDISSKINVLKTYLENPYKEIDHQKKKMKRKRS